MKIESREIDERLAAEEARLAEELRWAEHDAAPITPLEDPYGTKEAELGHLMMFRVIDASQASDEWARYYLDL